MSSLDEEKFLRGHLGFRGGKSAYEIALEMGFEGTKDEWLDWIYNYCETELENRELQQVTTNKNDIATLVERFEQQLENMTLDDPSSAEIVDARGTFNLLKDRLKNIEDIKSDKCVNITQANTDLNDYIDEGLYFFDASYTPINIPEGVNGWLKVINKDISVKSIIKQIWYRYGTANVNDFEIYVRTYHGLEETWSNWVKILSQKDYLNLMGEIDLRLKRISNNLEFGNDLYQMPNNSYANYNTNTLNKPPASAFCDYGTVMKIQSASGYHLVLFGNLTIKGNDIAINSYINNSWTGWRYCGKPEYLHPNKLTLQATGLNGSCDINIRAYGNVITYYIKATCTSGQYALFSTNAGFIPEAYRPSVQPVQAESGDNYFSIDPNGSVDGTLVVGGASTPYTKYFCVTFVQ